MQSAGGHTDQKRHDPALDGIRGLAILLVLGHHLFGIGNDFGSRILHGIAWLQVSAWVGVDLFFALSGYLITGILWKSLGAPGYFRSFYIRRSLRIWPLYYGVLLGLGALTPLLKLNWHGTWWAFALYLQNTGLVPTREAYTLSPQLRLVHFWSLAIEEQFYLVWPLCLLLLQRPRRVVMVATSGALLSLAMRIAFLHAGFSPWAVFTCTPCRLDAILLGSALAVVMQTDHRKRIQSAAPLACLASCAALFALALPDGLLWETRARVLTFGIFLMAVSSVSLIGWTTNPASSVRRLLGSSLLRFFGRYSYGIYVFHYLASEWAETTLRKRLIPVLHSRIAAGLLASSVVLVGSIVVALLSYHLFESRFLALKRFFPEPRAGSDLASSFSRGAVDARPTQ